MPYFIWDTPDYKDLDKKLWVATKLATVYSTISAGFTCFSNFLPPTGKAYLYYYSRVWIPNVFGANAAILTAFAVSKARGDVDNHWNYLPAAFAFAGTKASLLQVFDRKFLWGYRFGWALAVTLPTFILAKNGHNQRKGGYPLYYSFEYGTVGDAFGNLRSIQPSVENIPQDWGRRQ